MFNFQPRVKKLDKSKAPRVVRNRNDSFIDAAYEGKIKTILKMLKEGQPVDALHSYTQTTALAAATAAMRWFRCFLFLRICVIWFRV